MITGGPLPSKMFPAMAAPSFLRTANPSAFATVRGLRWGRRSCSCASGGLELPAPDGLKAPCDASETERYTQHDCVEPFTLGQTFEAF